MALSCIVEPENEMPPLATDAGTIRQRIQCPFAQVFRRYTPLTAHRLPAPHWQLMRRVNHSLPVLSQVRLEHQLGHHHLPGIAVKAAAELRL